MTACLVSLLCHTMARNIVPAPGLIKLPNRDREQERAESHNWCLMKWPPHQTAACKSSGWPGWHHPPSGHQSSLNHPSLTLVSTALN